MGLAIFLQLRETGINEDHPNEDKTTHAELVLRDNKLYTITCVCQSLEGRQKSEKALCWNERKGFRYALIGDCCHGETGDHLPSEASYMNG